MSAPLAAGDPCLLFDSKGRRYLMNLTPGRVFQYHLGSLPHDDIIGTGDGSIHTSSKGSRLTAIRPRLSDYVLKMERGAQVVYPKDAGWVLVSADIGPGMTVLEAGTGSGALAMVLARAVGPTGRVVSVERRDDHHAHASRRIAGFFGEVPPQLELRQGAVEDVIAEIAPDRLVLDIPEPWHIVPEAAETMPDGSVYCAYLPTVPQVQETRRAMAATKRFIDVVTVEVLVREWPIEGRSVRPAHRMVGHTGFITTGRKIAGAPVSATDQEE
ncbi:MAG: tRNA (adenine-N1)-methyltransferase [Acidimicrobiia bacterium]|nr:tRNA (adenine-N1)-methyltransferase [Acidimicrobiia bacterium]NNC74070.1 tRNA (adenine-N1)-methyltransferase [Acidimicrobiia bacterium]